MRISKAKYLIIAIIINLIFILAFYFYIKIDREALQNNNKSLNTIRIAHFANLTHSQALIGREKEYFQKQFGKKIKIEWKVFNAGSSEIEAFLANEVDIGYIGPIPAINGYIKSHGDLKIIAGAADAGAILVSRKGVKINSIKDLNGKKVSIPQYGNTQDLLLRYLLKDNGMKDITKGGKVEIIQVENPDVQILFSKGEIDAALLPEPWGTLLINKENANLVFDYNRIFNDGKYSSAVVIARTDFINKHPDIVKKFLQAHVEATEYINKNKNVAINEINSQIKKLTKKEIEQQVLKDSLNRIIITYNPEKKSLLEFKDILSEIGVIDKNSNIDNIFHLTILNQILKEKGLGTID
ncbi:aliphatic sulfonate ABC transporter substrate-binding protein [Caldicellulosiruptoraceae bacterium PP1]